MPVIAPLAGVAVNGIASAIGGHGGGNGQIQGVTDFQMPTTVNQANTAYDQTQAGINQQQAFVNALGAQNGLGHQTDVYNQLQGVANGTGPNPAQAQLAQATGANTANQAALMASQRGTGANAGLLARQAAMQGGANQQNAAGQAATLQAQQSLNALGQAGAMANQQAGQQAQGLQTLNQASQGQQSNILSAIGQQNAVKQANQANLNNAHAGIAQQNNQAGINAGTGLASGVGTAISALAGGGGSKSTPAAGNNGTQFGDYSALAHGGEVPFHWGGHLSGAPMPAMASGGTVPAMVSPGEAYLPPEALAKVAQSKDKGGTIKQEAKKVPGKAKVKGDSLKNDTVPAALEPGGVVIPRTAMAHAESAAKFVEAILAHSKAGMKK